MTNLRKRWLTDSTTLVTLADNTAFLSHILLRIYFQFLPDVEDEWRHYL